MLYFKLHPNRDFNITFTQLAGNHVNNVVVVINEPNNRQVIITDNRNRRRASLEYTNRTREIIEIQITHTMSGGGADIIGFWRMFLDPSPRENRIKIKSWDQVPRPTEHAVELDIVITNH